MIEIGNKGSDGFEPPKYLASLIAAVNDGAKAAQGGALVFALVGVYLLATAFSASDEDLLRGRTVTISQIGAALPVSFSFAIAPFVFVFLHIYTLVRYDMLAANVRQFLAELQRTVLWEVDRERCRQLLANVEFIQARIALRGSPQYSRVWRWLVWGVVAFFPVFVLLLVQINALRYQSELITRVQQAALFIDLLALAWFFHRAPLDGSVPQREGWLAWTRHWAKLGWLPAAIMGLNLAYMNVVPVAADVRLVRYEGQPTGVPKGSRPPLEGLVHYLADTSKQPLDVALCPLLGWGCRYLRVDHRTLVDHVWDDKAIVDLRSGSAEQAKPLAAIEGLVLRNRSLRFAVLDESSLFAADLSGADLRNATLREARLPNARLLAAQLRGADLSWAWLAGASFFNAQLQDAKLNGARLRGADLGNAQLQGANLANAQLQGAWLLGTQLQGAILGGGQLEFATLDSAQLQGANLGNAQLQVASLLYADLQGAELPVAGLQGADLRGTQLQGADLSGAKLYGATLGRVLIEGAVVGPPETNLGLSDLRRADFSTPLTDNDMTSLRAILGKIPNDYWKARAEDRLGHLFAAGQRKGQVVFVASPERQVLVSDPENPVYTDTPANWLITSPTPGYTTAFAVLLADGLATTNSAIAKEIAGRARGGISGESRSLYAPLACRLLANVEADKVKLERKAVDDLANELRSRKIECGPLNSAMPH